MFVLRPAQAVNSAIGRHWALHMQGFSVLWNRMLVAWHGISPRCSVLFSVVGHDQRNNPGGPISTETRINERIRVPEVRLIGPGGEQVGIVRIEDALRVAVDADLDLVEVAPDAKPPVCKIMDYGKFKYETALKERESRKNQQQTVVKEQKLRPKIDPHDYETKKGHVVRFLEAGSKVKVTIMFRGREQSRPELGYRLLQKLGADVADYGFVETSAKQDGRNMTMVLAPHRGAKTKARAAHDAAAPPAQRASAAAAPAPAPAEAPTETPDSPPT
jgi:translation initiation factor IF-3